MYSRLEKACVLSIWYDLFTNYIRQSATSPPPPDTPAPETVNNNEKSTVPDFVRSKPYGIFVAFGGSKGGLRKMPPPSVLNISYRNDHL